MSEETGVSLSFTLAAASSCLVELLPNGGFSKKVNWLAKCRTVKGLLFLDVGVVYRSVQYRIINVFKERILISLGLLVPVLLKIKKRTGSHKCDAITLTHLGSNLL